MANQFNSTVETFKYIEENVFFKFKCLKNFVAVLIFHYWSSAAALTSLLAKEGQAAT